MTALIVACVNGGAAKGLCQWLNGNQSPDAWRTGATITVPTDNREYASMVLDHAFAMGWITNSQLAYAYTAFQNAQNALGDSK